MVSTPIYFYGLSDRDEYEIKVSPNLLEKAQRYLKRKEIELNHIMDTGANRIGVSFTLRKDQSQLIVNLLKELTTQE
ncbi:MAG: hypothetical protein U5K00_00545 [Melioribacteraceae bacterium]|nr:hypothetical protein [Melioribacteraceae bacterium]